MVRMINTAYGNEMWVSEDRVDEYKAAGHKLAADSEVREPAEEKTERPKGRKTVKK